MSYDQEEVTRVVDRAITVGELIEALSDYPKHYAVLATSDYGDHSHTEQVHTFDDSNIEELADVQRLATSGYSKSGVSLRETDEPTDEGPREVVLIRL